MKFQKTLIYVMCASLLAFGSCDTVKNANNTTKGGVIGAAGGAALGAIIGKIAGNAGVGAAMGAVVGTGAGIIIGKKMDKARKEVEQAVPNATIEDVTDSNGLQAEKVTFENKILFDTNKAELSTSAKQNLANFADVLKKYSDVDLTIYGHTDSTGNDQINDPLSLRRAKAVSEFLTQCGVSADKFKSVEGKGSHQPVATNATANGRSLNRRVEVYMYASEQMIKNAEQSASEKK
ncbi:MAG: OmpA family protein [Prevotellaceae bacterium]|nr:OmpA family protein [Prevotellaceae bacterium]MDY3855641.1 OmpA family protein [Bacteroidaceae bacterium]